MKNTPLFALLISCLFILSSCSEKNEMDILETKSIFLNTFESAPFWSNGAPDLRIKNIEGHSGNYVCALDSQRIYSATFESAFGKISATPLKTINGSAFVKVKNINASAQFVVHVDVKDEAGQVKTIYLVESNVDFKTKNKINEWTEAKFTAQIPANAKATDLVRVFLFNTSKEEVLIDDMRISFE